MWIGLEHHGDPTVGSTQNSCGHSSRQVTTKQLSTSIPSSISRSIQTKQTRLRHVQTTTPIRKARTCAKLIISKHARSVIWGVSVDVTTTRNNANCSNSCIVLKDCTSRRYQTRIGQAHHGSMQWNPVLSKLVLTMPLYQSVPRMFHKAPNFQTLLMPSPSTSSHNTCNTFLGSHWITSRWAMFVIHALKVGSVVTTRVLQNQQAVPPSALRNVREGKR